uniref:tRNA pseudouridine synthase n=1 Tax=Rhizophora mucronata TaxID=61149 RepID=A0A2P2K145_RHIMU
MFFMIRQQIRRFIGYKAMEAHPESNVRVYSRYDHSDSCKYFRWTARESFRFMYDRPWQEVNNFYSNMVNGHSSLFDLFSDEVGERSFIHDTARTQEVTNPAQCEDVSNEGKSRRWERVTFKVVLSYHGISFDGWQKQPGLSTVQSLIESSLGKFVDDRKAQLLKDKHKPLEGCAVVAGRTDKGVSALGQVCSFCMLFHYNVYNSFTIILTILTTISLVCLSSPLICFLTIVPFVRG